MRIRGLGTGLPSGSRSAHEPQNATTDFQQLAHFEVHGRNARKKFGVVSFWLQGVPGID
jgi:hypothetical protein